MRVKNKRKYFHFLSSSCAFTIVELIVVIAIMGIIISAVSIRINDSIKEVKLDAAAKQIKEHIKLAKGYAKSTQNKYYISFDASANTYGVYKSSDDSLVKELSSGKDINYDLDTDRQLKGTEITSADFDGEQILEFNVKGRPLSGKGGSSLSSEGTVTVTYDSYSVTISVQPITGQVSIE